MCLRIFKYSKTLLLYIFQDCHVTYREIEVSLDISGNSIHSILHEHLTAKKNCSCWITHNLTITQKRLVSIRQKKFLQNTTAMLQNKSMPSLQVTNHWSRRTSPKVNSSRLYESLRWTKSKKSCSHTMHFEACFFGKTGNVTTINATSNYQFWTLHKY